MYIILFLVLVGALASLNAVMDHIEDRPEKWERWYRKKNSAAFKGIRRWLPWRDGWHLAKWLFVGGAIGGSYMAGIFAPESTRIYSVLAAAAIIYFVFFEATYRGLER